MRVIAGKLKGRTLFSPKGDSIRPTTDRIKENVFNIIQWDVPGSRFLDLFCGAGGIGIEAISRGAKTVVFVDKDKDSIAITKANLEKVKAEGGELLFADYSVALARLKGRQFDIIFLDPPYSADFAEDILTAIEEYSLLSQDGTVIFEHNEELPACGNWQIVDKRKYGKINVSFLKIEE